MKTDDDIAVDLFQILNRLEKEEEEEEEGDGPWLLGYVQSELSPQRDPRSKWYLTTTEFPR